MFSSSVRIQDYSPTVFVCLVGVLRRFQHCTGHITTGRAEETST